MSLRFLVDTGWVIGYLNGQSDSVKRLTQLQPQGLALSVVSLAELYEGVWYSREPSHNEQALLEFLRGVTVLGIDEDVCKIFGKERGRLRAKHKAVGDFDLLIGATCIRHKLVIVTNNRRHFEMIEDLRFAESAS